MSFVKKFTSGLPDTKHQSWTVENSYMIQFPDISPKIHRFHSFALRIEKQMNLGYNSRGSLKRTDHQSHWFPQKNSTHLLCPRINFSVFFLVVSVLHLCFLTAFLVVQLLQLKSWQCPRKRISLSLKKLGSAMTRLTGRSPHKLVTPNKKISYLCTNCID